MSDLTHKQWVYLLLGSNIEPEKNIVSALGLLNNQVDIICVSNIWETSAVGSPGPNFLNCAVQIKTNRSQNVIKAEVLSKIENMLGRVRVEDKNAPRTIDLDPVIWKGKVKDPHIFSEPFLALPLSDLIPDLKNPITGMILSEYANDLKEKYFYRKRTDIKLPKSILFPRI